MLKDSFSPRVVTAAFHLEPVTLRSWHGERYELGCCEVTPSGHRRYAFADAVLIGLLADWTNPFRWGWGIRRAVALANTLRDAVHQIVSDYAAGAEPFLSLDTASPVVVAWQAPGERNGWKIHVFPRLSDWAAALQATASDPQFRGGQGRFDTITIDLSSAVKRAAAALTRHDVMGAADDVS